MDPNINMLNMLYDSITSLGKFLTFLIILVVVNIIMTLFKFWLDYKHHKQKFLMERKKLIFEKAISIEHEIFMMVDDLALFDKNQTAELATSTSEARDKLCSNRLYIEKKVFDAFDKALDYYSLISSNFRKKDPKKEAKLTDNIIKAFHG